MGSEILKVVNIEKNFGAFKAVENISFSVEKGDVFGFLGPNGSGKTTTIRMMLGLLKPDKGEVYINNFSIRKDFYKAVSQVGALVEGPAFYEYLTAEENLEIFGNYSGSKNKKLIGDLLDMVGLASRGKDKVKKYSLGMKQRLGIAQALLNNPKLLVLDEPINGLDPQGIKEIRNIISNLSSSGITVFLSSHILAEVEHTCNKVLIINSGKEIVSGRTEELTSASNGYEIQAVDNDMLVNYLKTIKGVSISKIDSFVGVKLDNMLQPEDLLTQIVKNQIKIKTYKPTKLSLEDYFFNVMGDN